MSRLSELIAKFRRIMLDADKAAARRLIEDYAKSYAAIRAESERYFRKLEAFAQSEGITLAEAAKLHPSWPLRAGNLDAFSGVVARELAALHALVEGSVTASQEQAIRLGLEHAERLFAEGLLATVPRTLAREVLAVSWARPNLTAFRSLIGALGDGTRLSKILAEYGADAAKAMRSTMLRSFALGNGPRETAHLLTKNMGSDLARALRVSRTEQMRAYRMANLEHFKANPMVQGWVWSALPDACEFCLGMDGSEHGLDEEMQTHPNCRCAEVPQVKSFEQLAEELGIPGLASIPEPIPA